MIVYGWRLGVAGVARRLLMLIALSAALAVPGFAAADRVALLIGNGTYGNPDLDLRNPANDASGLGAALEGLGFSIRVLLNADRTAFEASLAEFEAEAAGADVALVFFAGHGVQIRGENYLLAADFTDLTLDEVAGKGVPLTDIREVFDRIKPALGIVVLDACRNNPFVETGQAAQGLARSQGGTGTLIAYATDPGNVAYDGTGGNSFFTEALIGHVADPGVEVRLMFGRVRQQVALVTGGAQVPWVEELVLGEHFLEPDPAGAPKPDEIAGEIGAWQAASTGGGRADYEAYLAAYPDGLFRGFAEERLAALGEWVAEAAVGTDLASLESGDRGKLTVALATLGFLPQTRGAGAADADLDAALSKYVRQMTVDGTADLDRIYLDAAQVMVILGSTTAQRIRTDMAALASIELTLSMAGRARAELAGLAETEDAARAMLVSADRDIEAIAAARARVLDRLDENRTFYAGLLERGRSGFLPYLERSTAGLLEKSRGFPAFGTDLIGDADLFIRHAAQLGTELPEGSYEWIADFLPS